MLIFRSVGPEKVHDGAGCFFTTLKAGDKVNLVGFGTFSAVTRAAHTGRNPQTGAAIKIAAKTNGKFTPGKDMKDLHAKLAEVVKPEIEGERTVLKEGHQKKPSNLHNCNI